MSQRGLERNVQTVLRILRYFCLRGEHDDGLNVTQIEFAGSTYLFLPASSKDSRLWKGIRQSLVQNIHAVYYWKRPCSSKTFLLPESDAYSTDFLKDFHTMWKNCKGNTKLNWKTASGRTSSPSRTRMRLWGCRLRACRFYVCSIRSENTKIYHDDIKAFWWQIEPSLIQS